MARTAMRSEPCAVSRMTGNDASRSPIDLSSCTPSISGMAKSVTTASTPSRCSSASLPDLASTASWRRDWTNSFKAKSIAGSSSTRSRRAIASPWQERKRSRGGRAQALCAGVRQLAAMLDEGGPGHRHAQPRALLAGGEEGRPHALEHVRRHPAPRVAHVDRGRSVAFGDLDLDAASARRRFQRVRDQVEERFAETARIGIDASVAPPPQPHAGARCLRFEQQDHVVYQRAEGEALPPEFLERARERQV